MLVIFEAETNGSQEGNSLTVTQKQDNTSESNWWYTYPSEK